MKKYLWFIFLAGVMCYSCSPEFRKAKAKRKVADYLAAYPDLIKSNDSTWRDSVMTVLNVNKAQENRKKDSLAYLDMNNWAIENPSDGGSIDSIVIKKDTVYIVKWKDKPTRNTIAVSAQSYMKQECTAEKLLDPIHIDSLGFVLDVSYAGNKQNVTFQAKRYDFTNHDKKTEVVPCPEITFWQAAQKLNWLLAVLFVLSLPVIVRSIVSIVKLLIKV